MSILESVRERRKRLLARLTERPAEVLPVPILPILGGAVPARIVKQAFVEPTEVPIPGISALRTLPGFAYGEAYGETAGQWYRVTYPKSLKGAVPVCVARGRGGAITKKAIDRVSAVTIPSITIPSITIPKITIPKVGVRAFHCHSCGFGFFALSWRSCPECGSIDIGENTNPDRFEVIGWYRALYNAEKRLGSWKWGFSVLGVWVGVDINWIRDMVATVFAWLGYYFFGGNGAFVLADALSSQVDHVQSAVQGAFNTSIGSVNNAFKGAVSDVQDAFNKTIGGLNDGLKRQIDYVTDRINLRLSDLYAMWGLPENMAVTPVHTRNETDSGFDFQSFGKTTIHYIAIGGRLRL